MTKLKIKKGDTVTVISGGSKGVTGVVKKVIKDDVENIKVLVEGVNVRTKHVKPSNKTPGGIEKVETPIHISNVAIVDPKTGKPTRVGRKVVNKSTVRIAKRSGEQIA